MSSIEATIKIYATLKSRGNLHHVPREIPRELTATQIMYLFLDQFDHGRVVPTWPLV